MTYEQAVKELCDAIQKDSQPVSKDRLYYVRPEWFEAIQSAATKARKLIHEHEMQRPKDPAP